MKRYKWKYDPSVDVYWLYINAMRSDFRITPQIIGDINSRYALDIECEIVKLIEESKVLLDKVEILKAVQEIKFLGHGYNYDRAMAIV